MGILQILVVIVSSLLNLKEAFGLINGVGVWDRWSPWSSCSRPCGVGIQTRERHCLDDLPSWGAAANATVPSVKRLPSWRCSGDHFRYRTCNVKPCPRGTSDFRAEQCSKFNNVTFDGSRFQWEAFEKEGKDSCKLVCRAQEFDFYSVLADSVEDGTRCNSGRGVCVRGRCKALGCNGILGSSRRLDGCGVCGGRNETCQIISRWYTHPSLSLSGGYSYIDVIPATASRIRVWHEQPTSNYLAIRDSRGWHRADSRCEGNKKKKKGKYHINGDCAVMWSGNFHVANTTFVYQRPRAGDDRESLVADGPTSESLDIMVYSNEDNRGIHYEYTLPLTSQKPHRHHHKDDDSSDNSKSVVHTNSNISKHQPQSNVNVEEYDNHIARINRFDGRKSNVEEPVPELWSFSSSLNRENKIDEVDRSSNEVYAAARVPLVESKILIEYDDEQKDLSVPSGQGMKYSSHELPSDQGTAEELVKSNSIDDQTLTEPSRYIWKTQTSGGCSQTCGSGVQNTRIFCADSLSLAAVKDELCGLSSKPALKTQFCNTEACPPGWVAGSWSPCTTSCGDGSQKRKVTCRQYINADLSYEVSDHECSHVERPAIIRLCEDLPPCNTKWILSSWKNCSSTCGIGMRERRIVCLSQTGAVVGDELCRGLHRPRVTETCDMGSCQDGWYHAAQWNRRCAGACGRSTRVREVLCSIIPATNDKSKLLLPHRQIESDTCKPQQKPRERKSCNSRRTCSPTWVTGPWSECSARCGNGERWRLVLCAKARRGGAANTEIVVDSWCKHKRPAEREICKVKDCGPRWYVTAWTQCSASCDGGVRERQVRCIDDRLSVNNGTTLSADCNLKFKPHLRKSCNTQSCDAMRQREVSYQTCIDKLVNCHYIVQARFCRLKHYREQCCASCQYVAASKKESN